MNNSDQKLKQSVEVVDYDPNWPTIYQQEEDQLLSNLDTYFVRIAHIGSTAIPLQKAKPVIDIMAAIEILSTFEHLLPLLEVLGYECIETDMENRYFLRRIDDMTKQQYHLHVVALDSWATRKERLMRDYLLEHPQEVQAYGALKLELAKKYPDDSIAYTQAKTNFIQNLMDKACKKLGIAPINVWED